MCHNFLLLVRESLCFAMPSPLGHFDDISGNRSFNIFDIISDTESTISLISAKFETPC